VGRTRATDGESERPRGRRRRAAGQLAFERAATLGLLGALDPAGRVTLGACKGYHTRDFVATVRLRGAPLRVVGLRRFALETNRATAACFFRSLLAA